MADTAALAPTRTKVKKIPIWRRSPSLVIGAIIVALAFVVAAFPTLFAPDAAKPVTDLMDFTAMLQAPSAEHWFGTDNYGRDIYTMVIAATRLDLLIGLGSVALPFVVGTLLGLVCGYYGGKLDTIIMRVLDIFVAFPFMVLAIAIVAILGNGVMNLLIAMWIVSWPPYTRLVRSEVLIAKNSEYVQAAKTLGYSDAKIIFRHILPNAMGPIIVFTTLSVANSVLLEASLSFLGLGIARPQSSWGTMLSAAQNTQILSDNWWMWVPAGLMVLLTVLSINFLGDGLAEVLDPKSKGKEGV